MQSIGTTLDTTAPDDGEQSCQEISSQNRHPAVEDRREFRINGRTITTPLIVDSVSSVHKDVMLVDKVLKLAIEAIVPHTLVSAYDLTPALIRKLNQVSHKMFVVLDSGGFELKNSEITKPWDTEGYISVIKALNRGIVLSYDGVGIPFEEQIRLNKRVISETWDYGDYLFDFVFSELQPPEHEVREGRWRKVLRWLDRSKHWVRHHMYLRKLREQIMQALEILPIDIVGIPDDRLGYRLEDREKTVRYIRQTLDEIRTGIPLHILGIGDPGYIRSYVASGADIFDGTSWYRKVLWRTEEGDFGISSDLKKYYEVVLDCVCTICMTQKHSVLKYEEKVALALHNFCMYDELMQELQEM